MRRIIFTLLLGLTFSACKGEVGSLNFLNPSLMGPPDTPFTIHDTSKLIGGPLATGRIGDVLLENDKIRVIIEQPGKDPWVGNFGGGIIDADLVRGNEPGQDNFGFMHPLINIEWTANIYDYEVVNTGEDGGAKVFRTYGMIDVYDYLDVDFISPVAKAMTDQTLYYAPRFDDVNDPFNLTELKNLNTVVVTDYILEPGKNYVRIETTFENIGNEDVYLPVGEFVNGSGELMLLIPGLGFTPELMPQIQGDTPAVIYTGFENGRVSYGLFHDVSQYTEKGEEGEIKRLKSTSLSYSGVTGIIYGEDFLKVLPLGGKSEPKINFSVPAHGKRTVTRYFVVGDGSGGSLFDSGLRAIGISISAISGVVRSPNGTPVPGATVAVKNESDSTIVTYKTDSKGQFSGILSTGNTVFDQAFGSGKYKLGVYKRGYKISGAAVSGTCTPEVIDVTRASIAGVECTLGESGIIKLVGGVFDEGRGEKIPARMTIVGYTPSYRSKTGGHFEDKVIFERPLGVVDLYYVNANGTIGIDGVESIRLAPGDYQMVFTRGVEYSMVRTPVRVVGDSVVSVGPISLKKVIDTPGFVSADFHLHSIMSPDSAIRLERRVLAAAGEGMDILQSSDHDYVVDYGPYVHELAKEGHIKSGSLVTIAGDEISPNHIGHYNAFPLKYDSSKPCGGALDWGYKSTDIIGPEPDLVMSPREIVEYFRGLPEDPIVQINHISDLPTSLFILGGWVTTPFYYDGFGVGPLASYADPVLNRLVPKASAADYPYPFGASDMVWIDTDSIELVIGPELHDDFLFSSGLPTWFNLLNLGVILTATGDSDSHREIANPLGAPRNFVASNVDPADGMGDSGKFSMEDYKRAIRDHEVLVTTGPFVKTFASNDNGTMVSMGDIIVGKKIRFGVDVVSPEWAWFDTIEVYTNTEPIPADDENYVPAEGKAKDPAEFFAPYHIPRYYYESDYKFSLKDKTLADWKNENGVIKAHVEIEMDIEKDAWIMVVVRGTEGTDGYKSLFPFVTRALVDADNPSVAPEDVQIGNIDTLSLAGAPAWAFTNPIFVDVDGDGFKALYKEDWDVVQGSTTKIEPTSPASKGASTMPAKVKGKSVTATSANSHLF